MPGFPGLAIGAGLGQFAQQYQQQQAQREREQMLRLTLAKFQQEQQDRQGQRELGGLDLAPPGGGGGGMPFYSTMPTQQPAAAAPKPGGAGYTPPAGPLPDVARRAATASGVPADMFVAQMGGESGFNPNASNSVGAGHTGVAQFDPNTAKQYGVDPKNPEQSLQGAARYMADLYKRTGSWPEALKAYAGVKTDAGLKRVMAVPAYAKAFELAQQIGGGAQPGGQPQNLLGGGAQAGPQDDLQAQLAKIPPPSAGGLDLRPIMQRIQQQAPNATWQDKQRFLENYVRQHGPEATHQFQIDLDRYKTQVSTITEQFQHQRNRGETLADRAATGGSISTGPGGEQFNVQGTTARPITRTDTGQPLTKEVQGKGSHNIEISDGEGKVIFSGAAHQGPQGWIGDKDQQPVAIPAEGNIKILGTGGQGKQAAAQIQSMIGASSELVGETKNLMELPSTATAGVFQGLQGIPAPQLGDALKRTLANKLTPEESTDMATSFQGVARSLATIEAQGRATGLVGLTGMSAGLMPQAGDTLGNIWRKYATLRQIMERNIDAIHDSPNATREQKAFLEKLRGEMAQVVPFTVSEVNKMQHGDAETYSQAAKKAGLGQGGGGAFPPEAVEMLKNDKAPDAHQKFDAIFGAGAADRALGGGAGRPPPAASGAM